jgi:hypothetical protein
MDSDNTVAFVLAVLAMCMAVGTYIASGTKDCKNYTRNVMLYLTTGSLIMFATATFASQYRITLPITIASSIALILATVAIGTVKTPVPQHVLFIVVACLMGVSLVGIEDMSPFLDGSLVLAVIVFASVTAVAMQFGDRISTKATSVGVLTYFGAVIMYLVYLFGMYAYGSRIPSNVIIGAHVVFLLLGCFLTLRAVGRIEEQRTVCEKEGAQYPLAATRLLIRLFATIGDVKAISRGRR